MRLILGIIIGFALTVGGAYVADTSAGAGAQPMVNWDVVNDNLNDVKSHLRDAGAEIERGWKRLTG